MTSGPDMTGDDEGIGGERESAVRSRLALALDVDDLAAAESLARRLRPFFSVAKVGLELFTAAGPDAVSTFRNLGFDVFLDMKLHDIPTTVAKAATVAGSLGARFLTVHTAGGVAMLRAGVEGFAEGAQRAGLPTPELLGVTVLTSEAGVTAGLVRERVDVALDAGCRGLVCAGPDLAEVRLRASEAVLVVPGTRLPGGATHDQARTTTPLEALTAGADLLVIGRLVSDAPDPVEAAEALLEHLGQVPFEEGERERSEVARRADRPR